MCIALSHVHIRVVVAAVCESIWICYIIHNQRVRDSNITDVPHFYIRDDRFQPIQPQCRILQSTIPSLG
jgi:hypothetical protein